MSGKGVLGLWSRRDRFGLSTRVLRRIGESSDAMAAVSLRTSSTGRRKPLIDRVVHQAVGEPEHHDHRKEREQQAADHQASAKFRSQNPQPAFGEELEQIPHQHESERDEEQKDQQFERSEDHNLLIAVRSEKIQVEGNLGDESRQQQQYRHPGDIDDPLAPRGFFCGTIWLRPGHGDDSPASSQRREPSGRAEPIHYKRLRLHRPWCKGRGGGCKLSPGEEAPQ